MDRVPRAVLVLSFVLGVLLLLPCAAAALVTAGGSGWFWQSPQPTGMDETGVAFGGAHDVWAVGTSGILHSADGGITWSVQASYPLTALTGVAFCDAQHGYACGAQYVGGAMRPVALRTTDGGLTWLPATPPGAAGYALAVSAPDDVHAWLSGSRGQLWTTADGGTRWTPRTVGAFTGMLTCATADGVTGWAAGGGHVWRTTDGGADWRAQAAGLGSGSYVVRVLAPDADHAVVLAENDGGHDITSTVVATGDGGATWRRLYRTTAEQVTGMYAPGLDELYLLTSVETDTDLTAPAARVLHTADGGLTWSSTGLTSSATPEALAGSGPALCAVGSGILTSADGGATWLARIGGGSYEFSAAQALSPTDVWAVDQNGALLHSSDGVRWAEQDTPARYADTLEALSFPDALHGWVAGTTGDFSALLLHTSDGGVTWQPQHSALDGEVRGIDFVDAAHGWAIGQAERYGRYLEHTTDGGFTWTVQHPSSRLVGLEQLDFVDTDTGYVVGQLLPIGSQSENTMPADALFRTTDGGAAWKQRALPKGAQVLQLQFTDATTGWAVAMYAADGGPALLHTTDGGATWHKVSRFADTAEAVHFVDDATGWVAADAGIVATTDGGATWQQVSDDDDVALLAAADGGHAWAFGYDGAIVGTVDTAADTAPPVTVASADDLWHTGAQTVTLTAADVGGAGVAGTQYSLDEGATWQHGVSIPFPAPADHTGDGVHTVLYRSTDAAGNREATQLCLVLIDTLGPACGAPQKAVVSAGSIGILRFKAADATSGVARAVITLTDRAGRVRRTFVEHGGNWGMEPEPAFWWLRFRCDLKPGDYRITVTATDGAGNPQTVTGHNWLHVVRSGAPRQVRPHWPAGLPGTFMDSVPGVGSLGSAP